MKALKPFAQTFFSEWFLSPERDRERDGETTPAPTPGVGELISFGDETKGKGREVVDDEPWTTEWGTESGFHAGLCVAAFLFRLSLVLRTRGLITGKDVTGA